MWRWDITFHPVRPLQLFLRLGLVRLEDDAVVVTVAILELQEVLHRGVQGRLRQIGVVDLVLGEAVVLWLRGGNRVVSRGLGRCRLLLRVDLWGELPGGGLRRLLAEGLGRGLLLRRGEDLHEVGRLLLQRLLQGVSVWAGRAEGLVQPRRVARVDVLGGPFDRRLQGLLQRLLHGWVRHWPGLQRKRGVRGRQLVLQFEWRRGRRLGWAPRDVGSLDRGRLLRLRLECLRCLPVCHVPGQLWGLLRAGLANALLGLGREGRDFLERGRPIRLVFLGPLGDRKVLLRVRDLEPRRHIHFALLELV